MKTGWNLILVTVFLLAIGTPVRAEDVSMGIQTGSTLLDKALDKIAIRGSAWPDTLDVAQDISDKFGMSAALISKLIDRGYNYGEIYYVGLLQERSRVPLESIVAMHDKGLGWKDVAFKLGLSPREVNRTRLAVNKRSRVNPPMYTHDIFQQTVPLYLRGR
jgi:hypothetical protein